MSTVSERIRTFIVDKFPSARKRAIRSSDPLLENGIIDSLGVLDLVAFLEHEFMITISDEELDPENFQTVESLTDFVRRKRNGAPEV